MTTTTAERDAQAQGASCRPCNYSFNVLPAIFGGGVYCDVHGGFYCDARSDFNGYTKTTSDDLCLLRRQIIQIVIEGGTL